MLTIAEAQQRTELFLTEQMIEALRGHCQLSGARAPFCGPAPLERAAQ
jgi:hypothetical protein